MLGLPADHAAQLSAYHTGVIIAITIILFGGLANLIVSLRERDRQAAEGEQI
jgi:hypothetical protein